MFIKTFHLSPAFWLASLLWFPLVSCKEPVKMESAPQTPAAPATESEGVAAPEPVPAPQSEAPPVDPPPSAPPEPEPPLIAVVEVREDEAAKKITFSGQVSSRYQIQDLVDRFTHEFADHEIINQLRHEPELHDLNWMNRADDYLVPFLQTVENAHFHYQEGVTTLAGTVETQGHADQHSKMVVEILSDTDSRALENRLKVKKTE